MKLTLRLASQDGASVAEKVLEQGTLTIGRGAEADWVLEDPERTMSKLHCRIDSSADGFLLTDTSTNGVFLNDEPQPMGRGHASALAEGDTIGLGPYTLVVQIERSTAAAPLFEPEPEVEAVPVQAAMAYTGVPHTPGSPIAPIPEEPWLQAIPGGEFGPDRRAAAIGWEAPPEPADYAATGERKLEPLPGAHGTEFAQQSEHLSAMSTLMRTPAPQAVLPSDWNDSDPLENLELAKSNMAQDILSAASPAEPQMLIPEDFAVTMDEPAVLPATLRAPGTVAEHEALPIPELFPMPGSVSPGERGGLESIRLEPVSDPMAMETIVMEAVAPAPLPPLLPPASGPAVSAPEFRQEPPPPMAASLPALVGSEAAPTVSTSPADFLAGFLEAAGVSPETLAGVDMRAAGLDLGRLVLAAVEGVRDVLATRAMVKSELRVDQTIVQASGNNAMKFAPDVQRCLDAMVGHPPTSFLQGSVAMRQSLNDIKRHELALIAALNSVFNDLSSKLEPETILTRVRTENSLGSGLPMMREARAWAMYEESFREFQEAGGQNTGGSLLAPLAVAYARQVRGVP